MLFWVNLARKDKGTEPVAQVLRSGEMKSGRSIIARLSFELELHDTKTNGTVWTHSYNYDEPVSGKDVPSVVAALDRNVQRAAGEVAGALDQYFSSHPPK